MDISVVTVWYHPENLEDNLSVSKNLLSYGENDKITKIFIIDNSSFNNENLIPECIKSKTIYIPLFKNEGIAKALNIGCKEAKKNSFHWILTMDQDSFWKKEELNKFLLYFESTIIKDTNIASYAPNLNDPIILSTLAIVKRKLLGRKYVDKSIKRPKIEYPTSVMCSGNLINLSIWEKLLGFDEDLFIDEVDHDYCFKLIKAGYKILRNNDIYLNHHLGDKKRTFFPRRLNHKGIRIYYIFRNMIVIHKRFPEYTSYTEKDLRRFKFDAIFFNIDAISNLKYIKKAYKDAQKLHLGKYNN